MIWTKQKLDASVRETGWTVKILGGGNGHSDQDDQQGQECFRPRWRSLPFCLTFDKPGCQLVGPGQLLIKQGPLIRHGWRLQNNMKQWQRIHWYHPPWTKYKWDNMAPSLDSISNIPLGRGCCWRGGWRGNRGSPFNLVATWMCATPTCQPSKRKKERGESLLSTTD